MPSSAKFYREQAEAADLDARLAKDAEAKRTYQKVAAHWRALAENAEKKER